jgi:hypothetical protein
VFKGGIHYLGKNGFIIAFPVSNGAKVNVAAYRIWHDLEDGVYSDAIVDELLRKEAEAHGGFDLAKAQLGAVATTIKADSEGGDPWAEQGGGGRIASGRARWVSRVSAEQVKVAFAGWEPEVQVLINVSLLLMIWVPLIFACRVWIRHSDGQSMLFARWTLSLTSTCVY